jgi:hypothetical protein
VRRLSGRVIDLPEREGKKVNDWWTVAVSYFDHKNP